MVSANVTYHIEFVLVGGSSSLKTSRRESTSRRAILFLRSTSHSETVERLQQAVWEQCRPVRYH